MQLWFHRRYYLYIVHHFQKYHYIYPRLFFSVSISRLTPPIHHWLTSNYWRHYSYLVCEIDFHKMRFLSLSSQSSLKWTNFGITLDFTHCTRSEAFLNNESFCHYFDSPKKFFQAWRKYGMSQLHFWFFLTVIWPQSNCHIWGRTGWLFGKENYVVEIREISRPLSLLPISEENQRKFYHKIWGKIY